MLQKLNYQPDSRKEKKRNAYKDAKLLFSDSKWEVWTPKTYAASCTLGKGTEWCTADSRTDDFYYEYTELGPLYVFINKQNPKEKYQLHVETNSFMDEDDDEADLEDVLDTDDRLREFVYNESDILPEDVRNIIEAKNWSVTQVKYYIDEDRVTYIPGIDNEVDLFLYLGNERGWDMYEYYAGTIDYEELGYNLSKREYIQPEYGDIVSAGEYWCNDEDATYEEIGRACVDDEGIASDIVWEYVDEVEAVDACLYDIDYTFTTDGCVIDWHTRV